MNDVTTLAALALANQALLIKLIAVLKADGVISQTQVAQALERAYAVLEEGGDTVGLRARVLLESAAQGFEVG
jgi:hypothetical protein